MTLRTDLEVAVTAAVAGSDVVRDRFGSVQTADMKGAVDPVTATDREAEDAILTVLRAHRPDDHILAEESGGEAESNGRRWIIDPLDGTVNFIHGIPHVAVSVALYEGDEAQAGVIVDVMRDDVFTAARGAGARRNGEPISVSTQDEIGRSLLVTGFPYDRQQRAAEYTAPLTDALRVAQGVRRLGTAALDLAWVAAGRFDGYWEFSLKPWDVAAGLLLVVEAGGHATNEDGEASRVDDRFVIVTNGRIHRALETLLRPSIDRIL
jgi:myo-inositol-1(or 4)-monophosphatase